MAKTYPETVPSEFAASEILSDAYKRGWNHGHGIACHNVPKLGDRTFTEDMGWITVDADNIRDVHQSFCFSAESNARQYSPFEFTAHEFNEYGEGGGDSPSSEEIWEAFETGISDAILADLAEYTDSDYGVDPEA